MGPPHVQEVPAVTTTPQAVRRASPRTRPPAKKKPTKAPAGEQATTDPAAALLPQPEPVRLLDPDGTPLPARADYPEPPVKALRELYRRMVVGRRFDTQATALTKQGRLAVYPSARGQEACQVGAVLAVRDTDWVFPTYRESMALVSRGIDPVEVLTLLRGDWHCGYDPAQRHTAPQCTPLATQCVHAAGLAYGEAHQGRDTVALAFVGDGATSEGDFHEGVNFAAVFKAPVVFFVQNNKYAISVPLSRQTAAPSLAYKGVGYGVPSEQVDGNDPVAVLAVLTRAVEHARSGQGPFLVEAHTYRMEPHTNADDATRYRDAAEVDTWRDRDPVARLEAYLRTRGALDDAAVAAIADEAEAYAADLRARMNAQPAVDPLSLFDHVYAEPTPQLVEQRELVRTELAAAAEPEDGR
ncbi:pyruvate dehydrogenase (acetyl-transferring) E1 component subunit alpha [Micromonospora sp. NBC_01655]|uniref:pyruvate dehydrogenase (acetyl-transferring) E1 component subunit alpha n=1 Tax=Micromonospora sp. NBC_01655 TaxID=2975983 RepID=UPI00225B9638|nr:pyruvate dehydrogenase (acetyl-transferring) E1 component subunit alpha [Micromonospora sp. NBC_01655]MCX4472099.1 pyruvate dehydrogenase (acetyl-transferring) E1 component subunit alpha [Micromonospora sp. NBC_01655]